MFGKPMFEVRSSPVHGVGAFALRRIRKGTRIIEYLGERVSHEEADRRYESKDASDNHTFLFIVDSRTVIDAGVDGNDARFFNHSCNPNCESMIESRRVFIEAIRTIEPGEEMTYDYQIRREDDDPPGIDEVFACRCGFPECRGTMLWPPEPPRRAKRKRKRRSAAAKRSRQARKTGQRGKDAGQRGKDAGQRGMDAGQRGMDAGQRGMDAGQRGMDTERARRTPGKPARRR